MAVRNYTNTATEATLVGAVVGSDINIGLAAFTGFPAAPFTAAIDRGNASEEIVLVTGISGGTVTCTRGYDGTTAKSHATGASFLHVTVAKDYTEANLHVNATTAHGTTSAVVGLTDTQTLTNKTLTAPTLSSANLTGTATVASMTLSGTLSVTGVASFPGGLTSPSSTVTSLTVSGTATIATAAVTTGTVTNLTVTNSATIGNDLTVTDDLTVTSDATVGGILAVTGKGSADHLVLKHQSVAPASPAAGNGALWVAAGRVQLTESDGTGRRLNTHSLVAAWTGGTFYPGDTAEHTVTGEFRVYEGATLGWRQVGPHEVANAAARVALPVGSKYVGYQVRDLDTKGLYEWNGTAWGAVFTPRIIYREADGPIVTAANWETGTGTLPALATFTTNVPVRALVTVSVRQASGTGISLYGARINGLGATMQGINRGADEVRTVVGRIDLAAGTHTPSVVGGGFGGTATYYGMYLTIMLGVAE